METKAERCSKLGKSNKNKSRTSESIAKQKQTVAVNKAIKSTVYEDLKTLLLSGKSKPYYDNFLTTYLKAAVDNPNSIAGTTVAKTIFNENILTLLDESHQKEMANDLEFLKYKLAKCLFKEQREVLYEINHSRHILVCCSRRAGKTDLASGAIIESALNNGSRIIYINLTFSNAINQIFDNVVERSEKAGLAITMSSKSSGEIQWSNGASLRIMGNSNNAEIDKLRGESKVSLIIIDEFFHQRNMEYGINEVINPLMLDIKNSTLLCLGTPPRLPKTYGERCWTKEPTWKKYHWTFKDNPYIPEPDEFIETLCKNKGITIDSPFIQREYFGTIGAYDTEAMVMKDFKSYTEKPTFAIDKIAIGVDIGFEDYNGIVALGYNLDTKKAYVIEERKFNKASVTEIIDNIRQVYNNSLKLVTDSSNVNIYCDNNNKELVYELYSTQKLPAYTCYKYNKALAISQLSDWCRTEKILIPKDGFLYDEFERMLYKRDDEDNVLSEIDEELFHPDITMALLYASRQMWFDIGEENGGQSSNASNGW